MPPLNMLIKPASGNCNMRCKYCFYEDVSSRRETHSYGVMNYKTLEKLTSRACEYAEVLCNFSFQGGEPTLAGLPFFEKLIELFGHGQRNPAFPYSGYGKERRGRCGVYHDCKRYKAFCGLI